MKTLQRTLALFITSLFVVTLMVSLPGCTNQSPMGPKLSSDQDVSIITGKKKYVPVDPDGSESNIDKNNYPQFGQCTFHYKKKGYQGGKVKTANGSSFQVSKNSITPPPGTKAGDPVTITMEIDIVGDGNELVFSFSPSGCKFDPEAVLVLSYKDLPMDEDEIPQLFLLDENDETSYEKVEEMQVDIKNKKIYLSIPHFSRYSLIRR